MSTRVRFLSTLVVFNVLLVSTEAEAAFCLPEIHHVNIGGATGTGTGCDYVYADLQTAINNVACPNTVISIAGGVTLANVALEINGKTNLTIVGLGAGSTCISPPPICDPDVGCGGGGGGTPPPPNVRLQGTGGSSVFYIHGSSSVTLESLELTGGGGSFGGGIHFTGTGSLSLVGTKIDHNDATYGAGIQFNGSGGDASLTLGAGTIIEANTATGNGGGILVNGTARLFALQPYTEIAFNHAANGYGGGIEVEGPARADIGSPGYNGLAVVYGNDAAYGGGISANAVNDGQRPVVRLFTTDTANPGAISSNFASHTGGGVYLKPLASIPADFADAAFCALDFRIDNNSAQEGAAIYADEDNSTGTYQGSEVFLNTDDGTCSTPETVQSLGSVACVRGTTCNSVSGNQTMNSSNQPTAGSAILVQTNGTLNVNRLVMRGNKGAHVIRTFGPDPDTGTSRVANCLIADNTLTAEMIRIDDDGNGEGGTTITNCTIVNNGNEGAPVIYSAHAFTLTNSIIDELSINTLNYVGPGGGLNVSHVLATDISTLPSAAGIDLGEPLYVDAANRDYHLQPTSTGIDFAPASGGQDLDGNPRDIDLSGVAGNPTPRDIGAYERQNRFQCGTSNSIFCNGYEYSW
jgi:hypothetical protein